ncbi:MAG: hypothetical protein E5V25_09560 [Mesorhizobium sp.]|nr:MAG: hypothetical protein E5V25_09560 [Mesorhizobium sp.]
MLKRVPLLVALLAVTSPEVASAYIVPGHSQCPEANPRNTWVEFMMGDFRLPEGSPALAVFPDPYFSIHFIRDIGDVQASCYTVHYSGDQYWTVSGPVRDHNKNKSEERVGGDPEELQLNVWGGLFRFNEEGEVFYLADGQLAGHLYCFLGNECWKTPS